LPLSKYIPTIATNLATHDCGIHERGASASEMGSTHSETSWSRWLSSLFEGLQCCGTYGRMYSSVYIYVYRCSSVCMFVCMLSSHDGSKSKKSVLYGVHNNSQLLPTPPPTPSFGSSPPIANSIYFQEVDRHVSVAYNSCYNNLDHFYAEMSVLGDIAIDQLDRLTPQDVSNKKIANISIPLLVLQALDDPVTTWRNVAANHGLMHPDNLVRTGQGNLVVLLTRKGGHVGWPLGWWPSKNKWKFMNDDVAAGFVNAVLETRQHQRHQHQRHHQQSKLLDDLDSPDNEVCLAPSDHTSTVLPSNHQAR
jgi:hypothetical protein